MQIAYSIVVWFAQIVLRIIALFNSKIKSFLQERKATWADLQTWSKQEHKTPIICFHCASLGEYEMIVPIISNPQIQEKYSVVLSFFSSSGFKHAKPGDLVDAVFYLPIDSRKNMQRFVSMLQPQSFVFVKYDLWYNLIGALQQANVDVYLVNALLRKKQFITSILGAGVRSKMKKFKNIFVQDEASKTRLDSFGFANVSVTGDLRFDRVLQIKETAVTDERLKRFTADKTTLILGSSWQEEEKFLAAFLQESSLDFKVIIAPHDISKAHINEIKHLFQNVDLQLYSEEERQSRVLVLDNIGLLSKAYACADVAIIGGAFGKGLHNILEAAVWGMPILTGPNIHNFPEALELSQLGCLQTIDTPQSGNVRLHQWLTDDVERQNQKTRVLQWFSNKTGATEKVLKSF